MSYNDITALKLESDLARDMVCTSVGELIQKSIDAHVDLLEAYPDQIPDRRWYDTAIGIVRQLSPVGANQWESILARRVYRTGKDAAQ